MVKDRTKNFLGMSVALLTTFCLVCIGLGAIVYTLNRIPKTPTAIAISNNKVGFQSLPIREKTLSGFTIIIPRIGV